MRSIVVVIDFMFLCDENSRDGSIVTNGTTWTILCVEGDTTCPNCHRLVRPQRTGLIH